MLNINKARERQTILKLPSDRAARRRIVPNKKSTVIPGNAVEKGVFPGPNCRRHGKRRLFCRIIYSILLFTSIFVYDKLNLNFFKVLRRV